MTTPREDLKALLRRTKDHVERVRKEHPKARLLTATPLKPVEAPQAPSLPAAPKAQPPLHPKNADPQPKAPWAEDLAAFESQICGCLRCPLGPRRRQFVFGSGNPKARLVILGGAPGPDEDVKGLPFQGRAGVLLDSILRAMGLRREDVYLMHSVKCRTLGGAEPTPAESEACRPYFEQQLRLIKPAVVCALGAVPAAALLGEGFEFGRQRGKFQELQGMAVMPSYALFDIMQNESLKRPVWEDMKKVVAFLKTGAAP